MSQDYKLNALSQKIVEHRKQLKLTQKEVAQKLQISVLTYSGIERRTTSLNLKLMTQLAMFLEIKLATAFELYYN